MVVPSLAAFLTVILATFAPADAGETAGRSLARAQFCLVEVLRSEELPLGPTFSHTIRATMLVTLPNRPPFQLTVRRVIPWQSPPPRRGQRWHVSCEPALIETLRLD
jgi:hypothetical protein